MNLKLFYVCVLLTCIIRCDHELSQCRVGFHESMKADYACHDVSFAQTDHKWRAVKDLYKNFFEEGLEFSAEPRIPLIVHHIWLGSAVPDYAKHFRKTWIQYNPDWTFVLWTDHPAQEFGNVVLKSFDELQNYLALPDHEQFIIMDMRYVALQNQIAFSQRARNYGEKSDILRYEALHYIGGLYVDTDFECLRSFDDFHHCCDFYTGIAHSREFSLYNGLIGAAAGTDILGEIIELLADRPAIGDSLGYSGPHFFAECFLRQIAFFKGRAIAFPVTFFYSWPAYERHQPMSQAKSWLTPESYALHYWKVSWSK